MRASSWELRILLRYFWVYLHLIRRDQWPLLRLDHMYGDDKLRHMLLQDLYVVDFAASMEKHLLSCC